MGGESPPPPLKVGLKAKGGVVQGARAVLATRVKRNDEAEKVTIREGAIFAARFVAETLSPTPVRFSNVIK